MLTGVLFYSSCNEFKENKEVLNKNISANVNILPQNQVLLDLLVNGESIDLPQEESSVSIRTNSVQIPANINVSISNGRLTFGTKEDVDAFIKYSEYLQDNWDYSNSDQWDDTPQEINYIGDEALNALDNYLGHASLRSHYNLLEWYDEDFKSSLDFYLADPIEQLLLNANHEISIDNSCYKYLSELVIAVSKGCRKKDMALLEELGIHAQSPSITFINENTGKVPNGSTQVETREGCILDLKETTQGSATFNKVCIDALLFDPSSGQACGIALYSFDWGDGFTTTPLDGKDCHNYNVGNLNLMPGECKTFEVKVEATNLDNCGCDQKDYSKKLNINVCVPIGDCFLGKTDKSPEDFEFSYGGKNWKIKATLGQRSEDGIFANGKVWAKSILKRQKNNGKWRRRKPGKKLVARVYGNFIYNDCTLIGDAYCDNFDKSKKKRRKRVKVKHKNESEFSTLKDDSDIINGFHGDFEAKMSDSFTTGIYGFSLFE